MARYSTRGLQKILQVVLEHTQNNTNYKRKNGLTVKYYGGWYWLIEIFINFVIWVNITIKCIIKICFYIEGPWVKMGVPGSETLKNLILHKHTLKMEHDMKTSVLLAQVALVLFVNHPVNVNIM